MSYTKFIKDQDEFTEIFSTTSTISKVKNYHDAKLNLVLCSEHIIGTLKPILAVLLGVLVLQKVLTLPQIIIIAVIFVAGMFVSVDEKSSIKSFFHKSILYGILMSVFLALSSVFINKAIEDVGYWETNLFILVISQIVLLTTVPLFYKEIKNINFKQIGGVSLMALCLALGNIAANKAYADNISISTAIIALPISMFMVFILALVKPGFLEKHTVKVI